MRYSKDNLLEKLFFLSLDQVRKIHKELTEEKKILNITTYLSTFNTT
jgi:hypothetical protein